jgi:hypothetical protein
MGACHSASVHRQVPRHNQYKLTFLKEAGALSRKERVSVKSQCTSFNVSHAYNDLRRSRPFWPDEGKRIG